VAEVTYQKDITGLVVIDPYNDFISEGGKVWDRLKGVAEANSCIPHMVAVLEEARESRDSSLLRVASSVSCRRLRNVETRCADSEGGAVAQHLRIRYVGRRVLIAHTCVEATVRFAAELGYEVTMVKDATADYSDEEMHAALDINIPNYATAVVTTDEVVQAIWLVAPTNQ
jgi:ureidoacrylate peracid hydrolase